LAVKDKIYIKDLEIIAYHGVLKEEKELGQRFFISLEIQTDFREAGKNDDLTKTISYAEVCDDIEKIFLTAKYNLIEKCAEEIAEFLLEKYKRITELKVKIKKPWAPIRKAIDHVAVEIVRKRHKVYISLGSNMGDKEKNLNAALEEIKKFPGTKINKLSAFITTEPFGYTEQDVFLNAAAELETLFTPEELLKELLAAEQKLGRVREIKWGPRVIDLDILIYDDEIIDEENLTIPHPWMNERMFVLEPLAEIAPNLLHPVSRKRIWELKNKLEKNI
jgi:dihydroneopterin aldolase/2-amino-4-hydroxy-6-hydroxymethyldihydropteridine diphosphokinase